MELQGIKQQEKELYREGNYRNKTIGNGTIPERNGTTGIENGNMGIKLNGVELYWEWNLNG